MSSLSFTASQQASAITNASVKYGVPIATLLGVYGIETGFGSNVATSSAGAIGPWQFTAPNKGTGVTYPMTNAPTLSQFSQQTDAAAAYLAQLYKHATGNSASARWDEAIQGYSGGGYGLSQVNASAAKTPSALRQAIGVAIVSEPSNINVPGVSGPGGAVGTLDNTANTLANLPNSIPAAINNAVDTATSDAKYAAVLVAVLALGVMLIHHALSPSEGGGRRQLVVVP